VSDRAEQIARRLDSPIADVHFVRAPGRVNLIGDHTDYALGYCLPMAIDLECLLGVTPATGDRIRGQSLELGGVAVVPVDGSVDPRTIEPRWAGFVAGALQAVAAHGALVPALDLAVSSTVPAGSGLSSSSALAVSLTMAFADAADVSLSRDELAIAALDAEVRATGVPGGLMDQLAAVHGVADHALLIDCRDLAIEPIRMPDELAVLVAHCGVPRTLAGSEYANRRNATDKAAARLGLGSLRDATMRQVDHDPRARHVVSENARVEEFADALRAGALTALGPLLLESHASLRLDFEVSTPELDALVESFVAAGALGARLTGAGFGGCVVALAWRERASTVLARVTEGYRDRTGHTTTPIEVRAAGGATSSRGAGPSSARTRRE
jgi:galactokinase